MPVALAIPAADSLLSTLLARWGDPHAPDAPLRIMNPDADASEALQRIRLILERTLSSYAPHFGAQDSALYRRLIEVRDIETLSALFFRCFDLIVRTRGLAIAVLRQHEIYRILQGQKPP